MTKVWSPIKPSNRNQIELIDERIRELQKIKKDLEEEEKRRECHSTISLDFGTSNIVVMRNGKILVDEPAVIAYWETTNQVIAVGNEAKERYRMQYMKLIHPMKEDVDTEFNCMESLLQGLFQRQINDHKDFRTDYRYDWPKTIITSKRLPLFANTKMAVGIPLNCTYTKRRCLREAIESIGFNKVSMISEPIAAAIGLGLDIQEPHGQMIIDMGGGWTQIAVISLGGIVIGKTIDVGGNDLTWAIKEGVQKDYQIGISEQMAEKIKLNIGSALPVEDTKKHTLRGLRLFSAELLEVSLTAKEIAQWIDEPLQQLERGITSVLESLSPELFNDIASDSIVLVGGGALLPRLAERLKKKTKINFIVADDPLHLVARSVGLASECYSTNEE